MRFERDELRYWQAIRKKRFVKISVAGQRKEHLAPCDEFGVPSPRTLCRKDYEPGNLTWSEPMERRTGAECANCLQKYDARTRPILTRRSTPAETKMHWSRYGEPACGQNCHVISTDYLGWVECKKC